MQMLRYGKRRENAIRLAGDKEARIVVALRGAVF